jgi:transposase
MNLYVGADISKGYADFCVVDEDGDMVREFQLDDTRRGHDRMAGIVRGMAEDMSGDEELLLGMEATGGLESNWLGLLEKLNDEIELAVYRINPFVMRKYAEQQLHAGKTDRISARRVAEYLSSGSVDGNHPYSEKGPAPGLRTLARKTKRMIDESTDLKNELHALLQRVHPELVQYARGHLSQWVLKLIREHPTPNQVVEAGPKKLAEIPFITEEKAERLVKAARSSVASQTDADTALTLSLVAEDLLRLERRIDRLKERLWDRISDRHAPRILKSIEGIGRWGATVLYCEIGDITRFASARKLIAYAGLDPQVEESGDQKIEKTISKQGNRHIRSVLYGCVTAAIRSRSNPPVRALFDRLKAKGKHQKVAEVACMRKLLAIVYGCWSKGQRFDPTFEKRLKARQQDASQEGNQDERQTAYRNADLSAPVSNREAQRRRKAASPQTSVSPSARGQGAFP